MLMTGRDQTLHDRLLRAVLKSMLREECRFLQPSSIENDNVFEVTDFQRVGSSDC